MDESEADDGAIHRFWVFVIQRAAQADTDDLLKLLILLLFFEQVKDTIPEPT